MRVHLEDLSMARSLRHIEVQLNLRSSRCFQLYQALNRHGYYVRYPLKYDRYNDAADYQLCSVLIQEARHLA